VASGSDAAHPAAGRDPSPDRRRSTATLIALIWALGISGGLLLYWGSKLTFFLDDWEFLIYRRGFNADVILNPHGENIVAGPMLVYKLFLAVFGMSSSFPWVVLLIGSFLTTAALLFVYLRRRVGGIAALAGTAVFLFLGAGWEDLLWPFQINYLVAMAAGMGALVAFDRDDRRGEIIACALLVVATLFSSLGLPFLACFLVLILVREDRWQRIWVIVVPAAIFAIWWLGWGHTAETGFTIANVARSPIYILNGYASSLASLFGLSTPTSETVAGGLEWGRPLLAVAVPLTLFRIWKVGISRQFWGILALGLSFWMLDAFYAEAGRSPVSSRYALIGVLFLLLLAAELLRGLRIERRAATWTLALIWVAALASIASNAYYLHQAYTSYHQTAVLEKSSLGAVELARGIVAPNFLLSEEVTGTGYVSIEAGAYFSARDDYGSPGYDEAELAEAPEPGRYAADKVLFDGERAKISTVPASSLPGGEAKPAEGEGTFAVPAAGCIRAIPTAGVTPLLTLPAGGAYVQAGPQPVANVELRRFADEFAIQLHEGVESGETIEVALPRDRSSVPWKMQLETPGPATVCGPRR
jgi:hypothetical protein